MKFRFGDWVESEYFGLHGKVIDTRTVEFEDETENQSRVIGEDGYGCWYPDRYLQVSSNPKND